MNSEDLATKIPDILLHFGIHNLTEIEDRYYGCCPIHGGDHPTGFRLFKHGKAWRCYTHNCHTFFGSTMPGFVRGMLSRKKFLWSKRTDESVDWRTTYQYIEKRFKVQNRSSYRLANFNTETNPAHEYEISREKVRDTLIYPCSYFINRGFEDSILDRYDIGICKNPRKTMFYRAVAPIYDDNYRFSIGCMGRSLYNKCSKCELFHSPRIGCPNPGPYFIKWRNSKFDRKSILYNFWFSKDYMRAASKAILCEGPADIWKLEQAGIKNSVAICGTELTDNQILKLTKLKINEIILCLDNDEAGIEASQRIVEKCKKLFDIHIPQICDQDKDIADTSIERIQKVLKEYAAYN